MPAPTPTAGVVWRPAALEQLEQLQRHCQFYPDARDRSPAATSEASSCYALRQLRAAVGEVLGLDPRPPQSRSRSAAGRGGTTHHYWALDFDGLSLAFRLVEGGQPERGGKTTFEVLQVWQAAAREGGRASKGWLEALRAEIEAEEAVSEEASQKCSTTETTGGE
ncbi:unnamed protein product [Polarella glacialis]|uniref:Uncharacterized protein n=1 Tax=Polarella glacialis TaxID=89957 RepID=A0A813EFS7_POLGL|nr:unnamed protein product [Polarella glacialis]